MAAAVPEDARVVRTAGGFVTAVIAAATPVDARSEGERLRARVAADVADSELSAGVAGPKPGSSGAHFALVQAGMPAFRPSHFGFCDFSFSRKAFSFESMNSS